jgi:hypothetical protein
MNLQLSSTKILVPTSDKATNLNQINRRGVDWWVNIHALIDIAQRLLAR